MKSIAESLEVARSNLVERVTQKPVARPRRYSKAEDVKLLPLILEIMGERPTYGYRRMHTLLNKKLLDLGLHRVNHKRVYRMMRLHGLLLARHTGKRPALAHTGRVSVMRQNARWCSDAFEFSCEDGRTVRIVFALDACDREVIAFTATTGGIDGGIIQDLMLHCIEKRFNALQAPFPVEWLSDNAPCYTAKETRAFAAQLNLLCRFTPVRSPESNGLAEAFVKTFKRDYLFTHRLSDAVGVIKYLAEWFEDYNEAAPHKALRMLSPREFIRATQSMEHRGEGGGAALASDSPYKHVAAASAVTPRAQTELCPV
jgi:transposase InsO family protein